MGFALFLCRIEPKENGMKTFVWVVALLTASILGGCDASYTGEEGNFTFVDRTQYPDDALFVANTMDSAIAEGAEIEILVNNTSFVGGEIQLTSEDPSILELVKGEGSVFHFRAQNPGTTVLRGQNEAGETDSLTVRVAPIASSRILFFPWEPVVALPENLWESGLAIFPDTNLTIGVVHQEENGAQLAGHHALPFTWESTSETPGTVEEKENSVLGVYRSTGEVGAVEEIVVGEASSHAVEVVSAEGVDVLEIFLHTGNPGEGVLLEDGGEVELPAGDHQVAHLVLRTADGRYVAGEGPYAFDLSAQGPDGQDTVATTGFNSSESGLEGILAAGRGKVVSLSSGEFVFQATWGELQTTVSFRVIDPLQAESEVEEPFLQ